MEIAATSPTPMSVVTCSLTSLSSALFPSIEFEACGNFGDLEPSNILRLEAGSAQTKSSSSDSSSTKKPPTFFVLEESLGTGRGLFEIGGEELGGYDIGEDAEGILRLGGEEAGAPKSWLDFDLRGVSRSNLGPNKISGAEFLSTIRIVSFTSKNLPQLPPSVLNHFPALVFLRDCLLVN